MIKYCFVAAPRASVAVMLQADAVMLQADVGLWVGAGGRMEMDFRIRKFWWMDGLVNGWMD